MSKEPTIPAANIRGTVLRPVDEQDVEILIDWARREGWNPGLADAEAFHAADQEGFIGCYLGNRLVSGIAAVRYGESFGFIGLYITAEDCRGQGLGRAVWDAGMRHLEGRTICLDGVVEQQANYRRMGFEPAYDTLRWSGRWQGSAASAEVVLAGPELLEAILACDALYFPEPRRDFLTRWLMPPRQVLALVRNGRVEAYGVMRETHDGWKIGPLFAETPEDAQQILANGAARLSGQVLHLDVPEPQLSFAAFLKDKGFSRGFQTTRMYRGSPAAVRADGIFAVTTLELG
ncbi:GNAT family N-acetyltransferase [Rhizobium sp. SSA_523]|uniref:GNAT family N-acetyltransferase n=1 Tax=Rhizobium sp. SSA_523 TaxID=2952477 RepID=UPI002091BCBF|nr:GNAT family N-acetyltransferase [Rhizobium sp. SSA_523]MCO5734183.1 GNAT family N-acetyltransferase [Rhizobium sp. SSA_523]WKC21536.1 GNAT family N-acetyltransferase [Rhizobium sp. SSA_523]